ncbi:hypothetical protein RJP21_04920 [Paenibacillus sp. VCA1]|uniref:hypothetical protein n=1 Tax=Paenibacillus sp. VCA1 TaxID=3039148 RepID=UPI002871A5E5|nr:hypothetical protein [Paenibacillus sp. VCA1]MDR9852941.1 hypothetical protein [Paenibacillus sp. VCA1]
MKVTETHDIDNSGYEYDGKGSLTIDVKDDRGDSVYVDICAGEPEDAVFFRDLNGAYNISRAIKLAYEAGKRGEAFEYALIEEGE